MPHRLAGVPSQLASVPIDGVGSERKRTASNPLRPLYRTARWAKLRWATFVRDMFTCQMCGKIESDTSKLVCDHRRPHRGDLDLFWDEANVQTLCPLPCYSKHTQREEQATDLR
jgi:5-methylcytosine-specific restriction endonuclease McrA